MSNSVGSRLGTTQSQDFVLLALLALGGYVLYQVVQGVKATTQAVGTAASALYHGAQTLTSPIASALATAWVNMSPSMMSTMSVNGNVLWPDGTTTALSQLAVKQDNLGNVYVSDGQGLLFQLQPSNAQGNWPAIQITDPSQIGQAPGSANAAGALPPDFGVTNPQSW